MNQKKLILSLIKDDLIHVKLIRGFEKLGFYTDEYFLHLSSTIFELMGFKENKQTDKLFNQYIKLAEESIQIEISDSNSMNRLAQKIYNELCKKRRITPKSM